MRTWDRRWNVWLYSGFAVAGLMCVLGVSWIAWEIGSAVRATAGVAVQEYGGDQVTALIAYAASPSESYPSRNRAVWALGQLGDPRALPFLEKQYTGTPCDHSRMLCQVELKKAIQLCRGGTNVPATLWRHAFFLDRRP